MVVVIYFDEVVSEVRNCLRLSLELLRLKHGCFSQVLTVSQGSFELRLTMPPGICQKKPSFTILSQVRNKLYLNIKY